MPRIYVAGGWFSNEQEIALSDVEEIIRESKNEAFMPRHMNLGSIGSNWVEVFNTNVNEIRKCDIVVASTVGKDMGTLWECGYAYALDKKIVYYTPGIDKPNLMLGFSGIICRDRYELYDYIIRGIEPQKGKDYE